MNIEEVEPRARRLLGQAGDVVHAAAYPGDEIGRSSPDAAVLDPVVRNLSEVETLLGPGIGPANRDEGLPKLRETRARWRDSSQLRQVKCRCS